jgi:hypothetical protein
MIEATTQSSRLRVITDSGFGSNWGGPFCSLNGRVPLGKRFARGSPGLQPSPSWLKLRAGDWGRESMALNLASTYHLFLSLACGGLFAPQASSD